MVKKKRIALIVVTSLILSLILVILLSSSVRYAIVMTLFHVFSPTPEIFVEIKTVINDYNRTCEKGYEVKLARNIREGPNFDVVLEFKNSEIDNINGKLLFFLYFHNNFGFFEFSHSDEKSKYFNRNHQIITFSFGKFQLRYGNDAGLPVEINSVKDKFDVLIESNIISDFSFLDDFNGFIVLVLPQENGDVKDELREKYSFMIA